MLYVSVRKFSANATCMQDIFLRAIKKVTNMFYLWVLIEMDNATTSLLSIFIPNSNVKATFVQSTRTQRFLKAI